MIIALIIEILVLFFLFKFTVKQKTGEHFSKKSMTKFIIYGLLTGILLNLFQIVMGYYYGRARAEHKPLLHVLSLGLPTILHTAFDMFLISLMACIKDIDTTNLDKLDEATITSMPYYNIFIPLLVCAIAVVIAAAVGLIVSFYKIKKNRESTVMQKSVN